MIDTFQVQNFKSIRNLKYSINALNVLIGPNNSGKTSVLQTLALLKQSVSELNFNGPWVNLGNFKDAVYKHKDEASIDIAFRLRRRDVQHFGLYGGRYGGIICYLRIKGDRQRRPYVFQSRVIEADKEIIDFEKNRRFSDTARQAPKEDMISCFPNVAFDVKGIIPRASSGNSEQIELYRRIYEPIVDEFKRFLYYVSARRGISDRSESVDVRFRKRPEDVGLYGENTIPILAHIQDDEEYADSMERIRFWEKRFGLTDSVASIVESPEQPSYGLKVKNEKTDVQSNIVDVGFGVNQLFSVIVQCFYAPKTSIIMMEQPEAHLHPRSQADIADLLIDVVKYGNRVIVETHSEHLLLRLQRRIAEKTIHPKLVNIDYFDLTKDGTITTKLKIDENGYFVKPIPEGFFEEGFNEAIEHIKAARSQGDKSESKK